MYIISYTILNELIVSDKKVTSANVRYDWFIGDVKMQKDDGCIDISWGWIPIVDFAIAFKMIGRSLAKQDYGSERFEFTDTDGGIDVCRKMKIVEIRPSFDGDTLIVDFNEFYDEVERFYSSVIDNVYHANPILRHNEEFLQIIRVE